MIGKARVLVLAIVAVFVAAACGGAAASGPDPATTAPAAATLAANTPAAATLPPASAPATTSTPPAATAAASGGANDLIAQGKVVFTSVGPSGKGCQECHGANARGSTATDGTTSPSIVGTTEVKLRNALAGSAALMTNLKLSDQQIEAVLAYLKYLDQQ